MPSSENVSTRRQGSGSGFIEVCSSTRLAVWLFVLLAAVLIPFVFFRAQPFLRWAVATLLVLLGMNLACCTVTRFTSLRRPTLLCHGGFLLVLCGALWGMTGYVATVNLYENDQVSTLYRWDREEDFQPGFAVRVGQVRQSWYPVSVKIGVLRDGKKADLYETREGGFFDIDGVRIEVESFAVDTEQAALVARGGDGAELARISTADGSEFVHGGAVYAFRLVAFKEPAVREVAVPVEVLLDEAVAAAGVISINNPLDWQGHRIFLTSVDHDQYGNPYVGLQITKDPGVLVVYAGFAVLCVGALWRLLLLSRSRR